MMKNIIILLFAWLCTTSTLTAQPSLPTQVKAKRPSILYDKTYKMDDLLREFKKGSAWGQDRNAKAEPWVVYSDRAENPTFMEPNLNSKRFAELNFGEKVCIADIKNDMALVYSDEKVRTNYPNIPSTAKCKGWVPMMNLLLWNMCPTDERTVQKKGIIAINLDVLTKGQKFLPRKYQSPDNASKYANLEMDMHFYYVMKETEDGEFILLSTGARVDRSSSPFFGWVNKNAYTEWNQRSCLEPNYKQSYVMKHKDDKAYIYTDADKSSQLTWWQFGIADNKMNPLYKYRMNPSQLRFPVLSQPDGNGMVLCTSFADRREKSINAANKFVGTISKRVSQTGEQMMKMNIILAVEATTEMAKFLPAIKNALASCKEYVAQGFTVQVGLVLYRSIDEGVSEPIPLCNYDDSRLLSMLDLKKANSRLSGERNVSLAEAIERASDESCMGFKRDESNLLLLVGYHGTDDTSWPEEKLLSKLVANNIQLASVQVMRSSSGSCSRYFESVFNLGKKNVEKQYIKIGAKAIHTEARDKNGQVSNDGYVFRSSQAAKGGNPLFASFRFNKVLNEEMQPDELRRYISNAINGFSKSVQASKSIFDKSLDDVEFYPEFLKQKLGEDGYNNWKQVKAISAYGGYAHMEGNGDNESWLPVLYLSVDELRQLISDLRPVHEAAVNQDNSRDKYVNAVRALLRSHTQGSISDDDINKWDPDELESKIYGIVNVKSENMRFTKFKLGDITNRQKVSDAEYFDILDRFDKKFKKLEKIPAGYDFRMDVGGMYYYWIPLEDLP